MSSTEVQQMLDELASDPDDKHVPPSVRWQNKNIHVDKQNIKLLFFC